jgi:hypothetical protein
MRPKTLLVASRGIAASSRAQWKEKNKTSSVVYGQILVASDSISAIKYQLCLAPTICFVCLTSETTIQVASDHGETTTLLEVCSFSWYLLRSMVLYDRDDNFRPYEDQSQILLRHYPHELLQVSGSTYLPYRQSAGFNTCFCNASSVCFFCVSVSCLRISRSVSADQLLVIQRFKPSLQEEVRRTNQRVRLVSEASPSVADKRLLLYCPI